MLAYVTRLLGPAGGTVSATGAWRFAAVGLGGMLVDVLAFQALFALGAGLTAAHLASFGLAMVFNYILYSRWAFAEARDAGRGRAGERFARFVTVCLLALGLRGGVLMGAITFLDLPVQAAILFAIGAAAIVSYLGAAFFVFPSVDPLTPPALRWRVAAIGVVFYVAVLRLLFLGLIDLMPQEAYYWNYAQHLDIGYLDHPPLVAWLIWAGTSLFGHNEFGVRIAAWLCWWATAFFSFRLADNMFGRSAAFVSLLLVAVLPFYFGIGLVMTPDAALTASWAGALYFLERALLGRRRWAWWGVGACMGLGMLSKYTIALLGPAALLFILVDRPSRDWLRRPEPYLAAVLALVIFSPVLIWNLENGLASFVFQSARRMEALSRFSLPALIGGMAALLTPPGLIAALAAVWERLRLAFARSTDADTKRLSFFVAIFTLTPLSVFVAFSLKHTVELNWTGPLWLAVLPAMSATILTAAGRASAFRQRMIRAWTPTIAITLVIYGVGLGYLASGLPGLGYVAGLPETPVAWTEFGREVAAIGGEVKKETGQEPLLVGLDTYKLASELAFYGSRSGEPVSSSVGRGVVGQTSLMYGFWYPEAPLHGRPAVLFAFRRYQIDNPLLAEHFASLSAPMERTILKDGKPAGAVYYRVGYGLK
ncbi:dolichyl-phosphate beta-D-mannosyltransferase [Ancylobacter sp. TS-1]|nr:dolichyl-phosphate beta-D-mannosyltransferase [Ancylobacter sp. TS-1]